VVITSRPEDVRAAERVVLPGQGAMPDCMRELRESGLLPAVLEAAAAKPLFGVCVGMQMLLDRSEEGPSDGLGLVPGGAPVRPGRPAAAGRQPLQGAANGLEPGLPGAAARHVGRHRGGRLVLFRAQLHTQPSDARHSAGEADYGGRFTAALARDNIFATQFHPEKSADAGLALYRNFLRWKP
jgi:glutamine amidotransferase